MSYIEKVAIKDSAGHELDINASGEAKVNIADGSDVALGAIADAAVDTDTTGTVSGKLRGLVKLMVSLIANQTNKTQSAKITNGTIDVDVQTLATQVTSASKGLVTHSVIHGTPDSGVTYYDVQVKPDGSLPITVLSSSLPSGAATEATLADVKTSVQIIDDWDESDRAKVNLIVGQAGIAAGTGVDGATVPRVSLATNIPLPAGTNAIGKLTANSGVDIGDVDVTTANIDKIGGATLTIGQQLSAASIPVVLPAAQITTLTPPAAITGFATATKQDDQSALIGSVTESAPGTDTASSGLNGRLQRIAQRLTSLISLLPAALVGGRLDVNVGARVATTGTKTQGTSVLSLQSNAASTVLISSAVDVSKKLAANVFIHFGRRSATAAGAGVNIRIEGSSKSSGNGHWYPLAIFTTAFAAAEAEAVTGTVNAGQKVITCASTTNLTAGDIIYIDNGTIANSEWARIKSIVSNTSVTVEDDLINAQTGATMYDQAEMYACQLDLSAVGRLRVVVDGSVFTQACAIEVDMVTLDSLV